MSTAIPLGSLEINGYPPAWNGSFSSIPLSSLEVNGYIPFPTWSISAQAEATATPIYICVLTGAADGLEDLEIPISSFQAKMRDGDPSYISAYIPNIAAWADEINARENGDILIRKGYKFADGTRQLETIAWVDFENLRYDKGANSQTGVIMGHRTESASETGTKTVTLSGVSYKSLQENGLMRIRCSVNLFLRPGDTVIYDDEGSTIVAGYINYIVNTDYAWMEVTEAEEE